MPEPIPLDTVQRWMQAVVTNPAGVRVGVTSSDASELIDVGLANVDRVILPSSKLSSLERLEIYGRAYFGRLIECLQVQFPAVRHAVGDQAFDGLAFGYLVAHPSPTYTLATLGHRFDSYLEETRPDRNDDGEGSEPDFADFVIELARLEQTYSDVFDGPGPEQSTTLEATDLEGLTAEVFVQSRLKLHPSVRLLPFQFPVHEYATAVRKGLTATVSPPRGVYLAVTRRDYLVRRYEVTAAQYRVLSALRDGMTIGAALEAAWDVSDPIQPHEIRNWFQMWSAAPFFAELVRPSIDSL